APSRRPALSERRILDLPFGLFLLPGRRRLPRAAHPPGTVFEPADRAGFCASNGRICRGNSSGFALRNAYVCARGTMRRFPCTCLVAGCAVLRGCGPREPAPQAPLPATIPPSPRIIVGFDNRKLTLELPTPGYVTVLGVIHGMTLIGPARP